jgi:hypothetical protein
MPAGEDEAEMVLWSSAVSEKTSHMLRKEAMATSEKWCQTKGYGSTIFGTLIGGVVGAFLAYVIETKLLQHIDEFNEAAEASYVVVLGILIGLITFCILMAERNIRNLGGFDITRVRLLSVTMVILVALGVFFGLRFIAGTDIVAWVLLSSSFSLGICLGSRFFSSFARGPRSTSLLYILGSGVGGVTGGILVTLALLWRVNFSIDEGFAALLALLLSLIGGIVGLSIGTFRIISSLVFERGVEPIQSERGMLSRKQGLLAIFLIIVLILPLVTFQYYGAMGLSEDSARVGNWDEESIFSCSTFDAENTVVASVYNSEQIVEYLQDLPDKDIGVLATLCLLSREDRWTDEFRSVLLEEAANNEFVGVSGSVKAWQFDAMIRIYYYLLVTEKEPELFSESERGLILDWFAAINRDALETGWVDYAYALLFKIIPNGPYENQEIGAGLLAVLAEALQEEYPELSEEDRKYISEFGIGWGGNFRNSDDGIVYHHSTWVMNAYMMAEYGGQAEYLRGDNSRASFEWILKQWPSNGMSPAYNMPDSYTPFGVMVLGSYLFQDGRYKWLAERMLADEMENNRKIGENVLGLSYWDDDLPSVRPTSGSCYIRGTTGMAWRPGPLQPDKIVFRDGWEEDSMYALLNLRFSGWHSYKATNCFISVMYGEPFVVEDMELIEHDWLPAGKADHRDKKIDRMDLNGFQVKAGGLEKVIYRITGIGSPWYQDPPKFAEVVFFYTTPAVDFSKTRISNWHGWKHDRVSILMKNDYFVVFDYAKGGKAQEVALTWHLKGDPVLEDECIRLSQGDYSLAVHYPHSSDWYQPVILDTEHSYPAAGYIHESDVDFSMISKDRSEVGFITLFYPLKDDEQYSVERVGVEDEQGEPAYPKALGLRISNASRTSVIGTRFAPGEFSYGTIKTDSEAFVLDQSPGLWSIAFENGTTFQIESDDTPATVRLNGGELRESEEWYYSSGLVVVRTAADQGSIEIEF